MVHADKGEVRINGTPAEILTETTNLLAMVYKNMEETFGKKQADFLFAEMGKIAVNGFEILPELRESVEERIKEAFSDEIEI